MRLSWKYFREFKGPARADILSQTDVRSGEPSLLNRLARCIEHKREITAKPPIRYHTLPDSGIKVHKNRKCMRDQGQIKISCRQHHYQDQKAEVYLPLKHAPEICGQKQPRSKDDQKQCSRLPETPPKRLQKRTEHRRIFMKRIVNGYLIQRAGRRPQRKYQQTAQKPRYIQKY